MARVENPFSGNTYPNLFHSPAFGTEYQEASRAAFGKPKETVPARDVRYPAYAAKMSDGRLAVSYTHLTLPTILLV